MAASGKLTARAAHFEFGKNWARFAEGIDESAIETAMRGLRKLCPELRGRSFLDIGCGSGLSSLAALRLGAARVLATDIDENSVATACAVLSRFAAGQDWRVAQRSVLELEAGEGRFDLVYSWGVLHHTGAMWQALDHAAALVAPGGTLVIAIYGKTWLCPAWRVEKALYSRLPAPLQWPFRLAYVGAHVSSMVLRGRNPVAHIRGYDERSGRGMRYGTDVHDWLGGYPYESATPDEIGQFLHGAGFAIARKFAAPAGRIGLLGTGCDEYVAVRLRQARREP
jgi:2-polyprenyl-6-hydroxyphenyl methylase/3-demethylubiquinone-9 3-methyltransferase